MKNQVIEVKQVSKYQTNHDRYLFSRTVKGVFKGFGIKKAVSTSVYNYAIDNQLPCFYKVRNQTIYNKTLPTSLTKKEARKERDLMLDFLGGLHFTVGGMALPSLSNKEKRNCPHDRIKKLELQIEKERKVHRIAASVHVEDKLSVRLLMDTTIKLRAEIKEDKLSVRRLSDKLYTAQADLDVAKNLILTLKEDKSNWEYQNLEKSAKGLIDVRTIKTLSDDLHLAQDQLRVARENELRVTDRLRSIRTALDMKTWQYPED